MKSTTRSLLAAIFFYVVAFSNPTLAQVGMSGYQLPLDLAMDAAREAIRSCESSGYK
jgi:hypothetical protein